MKIKHAMLDFHENNPRQPLDLGNIMKNKTLILYFHGFTEKRLLPTKNP